MDYEQQILQEYLLEAREILADAEMIFLDLEAHPDDQTVIDNIFRMIHTLKGSAFAVGLNAFGRFAHRLENMLDLIRNHRLSITPDIISLALKATDAQKIWLEQLNIDAGFVADVHELSEQIRVIVSPFESEAPKSLLPAFGVFDEEPVASSAPHVDERPLIRLLLVDDQEDQIDIYVDMLRGYHTEIFRALDGIEALKVLREHNVDLIVTDLEMPLMSGLELIQRIRAADIATPIIFVSGIASRHQVISIVNAGANGFLEKPVTQEGLVVQVRTALKEKYLQDTIGSLTQLNFKAYLTSSQLARMRHDSARRLELEQRLCDVLDDIINLQNALLRPKLDERVL